MVRFGEALRKTRIPEYAPFYVDYELLKALVVADTTSSSINLATCLVPNAVHLDTPAGRFWSILDREFAKVNEFIASAARSLETRLQALLRGAMLWESSESSDDRRRELIKDATMSGETLVQLDLFISQNRLAFRKIIKKFDKVHGERFGAWLAARLATEGSFSTADLHRYVVTLSDAWSLLASSASTMGAWLKPPQSFERDTTKYWVRMDDLMRVMVTIVRHLPVCVFARQPPRAIDTSEFDLLLRSSMGGDIGSGGEDVATPWSWISSLYLDSADFEHYRRRQLREDGAQLLRVRWYGLDPHESGSVFLERKTHHEAWTGQASAKERLPLDAAEVAAVLSGAADVPGLCAQRVTRGEMVEREAAAAAKLGAEVQATVRADGLRPKVRSIYRRCAFQSTSSNTVRVTVDADLRLVADGGGETASAWCRHMTEGSISEAEIVAFPHAVLEVKLQGEAPEWVQQLIASELLRPAHKFSKYLTGAAALYNSLVPAAPEWFADPSLRECLRAASLAPAPPTPPTPRGARAGDSPARRRAAGDALPRWMSKLGPPPPDADAQAQQHGANGKADAQARCVWRGAVHQPLLPLTTARSDHSPPTTPTAAATGQPAKKAPASLFGGAAKIEPKTYFANERTFIQWVSVAALMLGMAVGLLEYAAFNGQPFLGGMLVGLLALCLMWYALRQFLCRDNAITAKRPHGYRDRNGPIILVAAMSCALLLLLASRLAPPGTWLNGTTAVASAGVHRSKEYQLDIDPAAFQNRTAGLETLLATLRAHLGADAVPAAATPLLLAAAASRRHLLSTPEGLGRTVVKQETQLSPTADPDASGRSYLAPTAPTSGSGGVTVTLKLDDADDGDLLLATPLYCAAQYAAHCYVKVEQGLFVWGTTTKFSRSARVSRLPSSTQLAAVTELEELFGRVDGLRAALGLSERQLRSSDPLLVTSRRYAWSLSFPVLVPSGTAVDIDLIVYYDSPAPLLSNPNACMPTSEHTPIELSFKLDAGVQGGPFDAPTVQAAHALLQALASSPLAATRRKALTLGERDLCTLKPNQKSRPSQSHTVNENWARRALVSPHSAEAGAGPV